MAFFCVLALHNSLKNTSAQNKVYPKRQQSMINHTTDLRECIHSTKTVDHKYSD